MSPTPEPKTRICDWCKKRIKVTCGIVLGSAGGTDKVWFCCDACNYVHDIA